MLGIITTNFAYISRNCYVIWYKSLVRSHLEYAMSSLYRLSRHVLDRPTNRNVLFVIISRIQRSMRPASVFSMWC